MVWAELESFWERVYWLARGEVVGVNTGMAARMNSIVVGVIFTDIGIERAPGARIRALCPWISHDAESAEPIERGCSW